VVADNKVCPGIPEEEIPPLSGAGIVLFGAQNVRVHDNKVRNNGSEAASAAKGVALTGFAGTEPSGTVEHDKVLGNAPFDLVGAGTVVFEDNRCGTSNPPGPCD
jgi:hypothetical protein